MSFGVGCRHGLDPELLWLWCRPAATALIRPLAWEPPYAMGAALEKTKKKKRTLICIYLVLLFRAAPEAYGCSQARDPIIATAASHSNARSKPGLQPTP